MQLPAHIFILSIPTSAFRFLLEMKRLRKNPTQNILPQKLKLQDLIK